jgi:Skp family chaperone for outer membrane proteins
MLKTRKNPSRRPLWAVAGPLLGLALGTTAACTRQEVDRSVDRAEHDVDHAVQKVKETLPPADQIKAKLKQVNSKIQEEGNEVLDDVRLVRDAHEQRRHDRDKTKPGD